MQGKFVVCKVARQRCRKSAESSKKQEARLASQTYEVRIHILIQFILSEVEVLAQIVRVDTGVQQ